MVDDKTLAGVMSEVSLKNLECADGDANDGIHKKRTTVLQNLKE